MDIWSDEYANVVMNFGGLLVATQLAYANVMMHTRIEGLNIYSS